jgi:hypothetical protein
LRLVTTAGRPPVRPRDRAGRSARPPALLSASSWSASFCSPVRDTRVADQLLSQ